MSSQPLLRALTHPHKHLQERASSYLATIDQWASRRGLTDVVREKTGGAGKLAVVVALAAKSLETTSKVHPQEQYLRQSGLSPTAFKAALDFLQQAITERDSNSTSTPPRTPSRRAAALSASAASSSTASPSSPMSLKERAMAVQSGQAFGKSPTTPTRRFTRTPSRGESSSSAASTPKSVRFDSAASSPAAESPTRTPRAVRSTTYEHPYTPSKRSRLGPQTQSATPKRTREDEEQEEEVLLPGSTVKRQRKLAPTRKILSAEQQLDVLLFPLDPLYLDKVRSRSEVKRVDVDQWLETWGEWLDGLHVREG